MQALHAVSWARNDGHAGEYDRLLGYRSFRPDELPEMAGAGPPPELNFIRGTAGSPLAPAASLKISTRSNEWPVWSGSRMGVG